MDSEQPGNSTSESDNAKSASNESCLCNLPVLFQKRFPRRLFSSNNQRALKPPPQSASPCKRPQAGARTHTALTMSRTNVDAAEVTPPVTGASSAISAEGSQSAVAGTTNLGAASLPPRVINLTVQSASGNEHQVYLLGTAHISDASVEDAVNLIRQLEPQVVMVELCRSRQGMLTMTDMKVPTMSEMLVSIRVQRVPVWQVLYGWVLATAAVEIGAIPGAEFRAAAEEAMSVGASVVLGDRPVDITIARVWAALSAWHKLKFIFTLLRSGFDMPDTEELRKMIEEMKDMDMLTQALREFTLEFPSMTQPLITERDMYMAHVLRHIAQDAPVVVAVVGAGHLAGIQEFWEQEIDIEEISRMPPKRKSWRPYILALAGLSVTTVVVIRWRKRS